MHFSFSKSIHQCPIQLHNRGYYYSWNSLGLKRMSDSLLVWSFIIRLLFKDFILNNESCFYCSFTSTLFFQQYTDFSLVTVYYFFWSLWHADTAIDSQYWSSSYQEAGVFVLTLLIISASMRVEMCVSWIIAVKNVNFSFRGHWNSCTFLCIDL